MTVPTRAQIAAQVGAVLERDPEARCIAIRSSGHADGPEQLAVGNRTFTVHWGGSPLAVRNLLVEADGDPDCRLVVLTDIDDFELGTDVIARFSRGRVFQPDGWEMVRRAFQAQEIDARLAGQGWMADCLLALAPTGGYPPVAGGFLDQDTAWRCVLENTLGISEDRPDAITLLQWSMRAENLDRFARLTEEMKLPISARLSACGGIAAELMVRCLNAGNGHEALPLGLVCGVIFAGIEPLPAELAAAAVRLERYISDRRIRPEEGKRWAEAAERVARSGEADNVRPFLDRADALLQELHILSHAGLSELLPSGYEARLGAFGTALLEVLANASVATVARAEVAAARCLEHDGGKAMNVRNERVRMALRCARWLASSRQTMNGFTDMARDYAQDGGYVDWARIKLLGGDELAALSSAYSALAEAVRIRREDGNRRFAEALRAWNALGGVTEAGCVPVEAVVSSVLKDLAETGPILLLVVDGMSFSIYRELCLDIFSQGWTEILPAGDTDPRVGIAALPTLTEVSRASLLSGQLVAGQASHEKTAFTGHPAFVGASRSGGKPILYHKGELGDGLGLAQEIREVIGSRDRRVVGVVYNAVDDHLDGSDQLHMRWSLDDLRLIKPILHDARSAGRVLILTSDHGHVIDEKTIQRSGEDGDRWRRASGEVRDGEVLLEKGRVRAPGGADRVVCAWSERLRYGAKRNGYHGGVSPQEVVVPIGVFAPPRVEVIGWKPAPPEQPVWWEEQQVPQVVFTAAPTTQPKTKKQQQKGQPELFIAISPTVRPDWVGALFASETYLEQKRLAARVAPPDDDIRRLLEALDERGGKLGKTVLAQRLGWPLVRVSGFINAVRRVLNVDQSPILSLDEQAATVEFNRGLLEVQFQLRAMRGISQ